MPLSAALAIGYRRGDKGTHCGLFYESDDRSMRMLHLAGHRSLLSYPTWPGYMEVATPKLENAQRIAISDFCRVIFEKYGLTGLPYSPRIAQYFAPDGTLVNGAVGAGFTCSTFVADIFRVRDCALVDLTAWRAANEKDAKFFEPFIKWFRERFPEDAPHFDAAQDPDCKGPRLKAEELCAAAAVAPPVVKQDDIKNAAQRLYKNLRHLHRPFDG